MGVYVYRIYYYTYISYFLCVHKHMCIYTHIHTLTCLGDLAERVRKHDTTSAPTRRPRSSYAHTQVLYIHVIYTLILHTIVRIYIYIF